MTTQSALKKVASAITGLQNSISNTFAEQAQNITATCRAAFGNANWEIPKDEMDAIVENVRDVSPWKGTSSEAARVSEVRAIVRGYPFLGAACKLFKDYYGELRREHVVKIARLIPDSEDAGSAQALAVDYFENRDKSRGKGGKSTTPAQKVANGIQAAINATNDASLKQALYRLAKKHNIKIK